MLKRFILWLFMVPFPACGMYEERPTLCPYAGNSVCIGIHAMNDTDPDKIFVMATIMLEKGIRFDEARITYQPTPKDKAQVIPIDGIHSTNDTIVLHFKIPRR